MRFLLNTGLLLTVIPFYGVAYFYISYFMNPQHPLRDECLIGVGMTVV